MVERIWAVDGLTGSFYYLFNTWFREIENSYVFKQVDKNKLGKYVN